VADPGTPTDLGRCQPAGALVNQSLPFELLGFSPGVVWVPGLTTTAVPGSPGFGVPKGSITIDEFFYYLVTFVAGC